MICNVCITALTDVCIILQTMDDENEEKQNLMEDKEESLKWVPRLKGVGAMVCYVLAASVSAVCVQMLERSIPDFELNAMRCGLPWICMTIYFIVKREIPKVLKENWLPVLLFSIVSNLVTIGLYVSVTLAPLATTECIMMSSVVFSGFLAYTLCNRERIRWDSLVVTPFCIAGLFLVLQPPPLFDQTTGQMYWSNEPQNTTEMQGSHSNEHGTEKWGYALAALTGVFLTLQIALVKYYGGFFSMKNSFISLMYSYAAGTIASLSFMVVFENPVFSADVATFLLVFGHATMYVFTMPLQLYSAQLISGNLGSIIRTFKLLVFLAAQYTILKNIYPGHRNWMEVLGVLFVLFGTMFSSLIEIKNGFQKK